jgi:hypothetical protein
MGRSLDSQSIDRRSEVRETQCWLSPFDVGERKRYTINTFGNYWLPLQPNTSSPDV